MKTIIRLSNRGKAKNPIWYIVVQTSGKKNQGLYRECIGYWLPRWTVFRQRAIVLNKHRARYWLDSNAVMSNKVRWLLNLGGMMPRGWIPHGRSHLYEKPKNTGKYIDDIKKVTSFERNIPKEVYEARREQDKDLIILRKMKEQTLAKSELYRKSLDDIQVEIDENFQIESDIVLRSKQFYMMKDIIKFMEDNLDQMSPSKKYLLKGKMHKMLKMGIISEDDLAEAEEEEVDAETLEGHEVRYQQMMQQLNGVASAMEQINLDSRPLAKEEAKEFLIDHLEDEPYKTSRLVNEIYEAAELTGDIVTMNDIKYYLEEVEENLVLPQNLNKLKVAQLYPDGDKVLYPPTQFLTPLPDITCLDPEDLYDMRHGPSKAIDPDMIGGNWFRSPKNYDENMIKMMEEAGHTNPRNWKSKKQYNIREDNGDLQAKKLAKKYYMQDKMRARAAAAREAAGA